jgi:thiopeptide-type bacteriocin biosynthesis protein
MTRVEWLQVNVNLFTDSGGDQPYVPWESLARQVSRWRAAGRFQVFWFVRKPPGLRLRFAGPDLGAQLEPALNEWLVAAEGANDIRGFRFGRYEPEVHRFGGPAGMAVAHDLFDCDSALVLRFESLDDARRRRIDRHNFALASAEDFLLLCLNDEAEVWDVWKRLAALLQDPRPNVRLDVGAIRASEPRQRLDSLDDEDGLTLARDATAGNRRVAAALRATVDAGRLAIGVRSWLAAAAAFQWNRWGLPLDLPRLAREVTAIAEAYTPDKPKPPQVS